MIFTSIILVCISLLASLRGTVGWPKLLVDNVSAGASTM